MPVKFQQVLDQGEKMILTGLDFNLSGMEVSDSDDI